MELMRPTVLAFAVALSIGCAHHREGTLVPVPPPARPVGELLAGLQDADAGVRAASAWALAGAGTVEADVFRALAAARDDPDAEVRKSVAWALGHVETGLQGDVPVDVPPQPVRITRPRYPLKAFDRHIEGTVTVTFLIDERGTVAHAEVRRSIPELDAAALACVRQWQFQPATRKGRPEPIVATAPVTFRID